MRSLSHMGNVIKVFVAIVVIAFLFGFIFSFLFKVGIILLVGLGILYLIRKVFLD